MRIFVNVSACELADPEFVDFVAGTLADSGLEPSRLILEVTDATVMRDINACPRHADLKRIGVGLGLDDVGPGYPILQHLRHLPLDVMKIARPWIDAVGETEADNAVVRELIALGHAVGLHVVAEGVERVEVSADLVDMGCDWAQGYYYARSLESEAIVTLLCRIRPAAAADAALRPRVTEVAKVRPDQPQFVCASSAAHAASCRAGEPAARDCVGCSTIPAANTRSRSWRAKRESGRPASSTSSRRSPSRRSSFAAGASRTSWTHPGYDAAVAGLLESSSLTTLDMLPERTRARLGRLLPQLATEASSADEDNGQHLLFEAVVELLAALMSEAPLVVVIDDVHWIDPAEPWSCCVTSPTTSTVSPYGSSSPTGPRRRARCRSCSRIWSARTRCASISSRSRTTP